MYTKKLLLIISLLFCASCSNECSHNEAMNKMLALGKVQGRMAAKGDHLGLTTSAALGKESGLVSELIAQEKYGEACLKADELAKKIGIDLVAEQKDMITFEQLAKDGGKGSGTCSIADAAKKQMEVHGLLQTEVDAGKRTSEVFSQFQKDTVGYAEMLSTNPSKACQLMDDLKVKYKL